MCGSNCFICCVSQALYFVVVKLFCCTEDVNQLQSWTLIVQLCLILLTISDVYRHE